MPGSNTCDKQEAKQNCPSENGKSQLPLIADARIDFVTHLLILARFSTVAALDEGICRRDSWSRALISVPAQAAADHHHDEEKEKEEEWCKNGGCEWLLE